MTDMQDKTVDGDGKEVINETIEEGRKRGVSINYAQKEDTQNTHPFCISSNTAERLVIKDKSEWKDILLLTNPLLRALYEM